MDPTPIVEPPADAATAPAAEKEDEEIEPAKPTVDPAVVLSRLREILATVNLDETTGEGRRLSRLCVSVCDPARREDAESEARG